MRPALLHTLNNLTTAYSFLNTRNFLVHDVEQKNLHGKLSVSSAVFPFGVRRRAVPQ